MDRNDILFVIMILGLIFLFDGEPDVWDKLHEQAMQSTSCKRPDTADK